MRVRVLGSGAGGGVPQWNCACGNCRAAREGRAPARTQSSLAVSADGERWFLLDASPDLRVQLQAAPQLAPRSGRGSPLAGVVLTSGDVDAVAGLLTLREETPLRIYATAPVREDLTAHNVLVNTLRRTPGQSRWSALLPGVRTALVDSAGAPSGLEVEAVPLPGKLPPHLAGRRQPSGLDVIALLVGDGRGATVLWAPQVSAPTPALLAALDRARLVFFDGTFATEDELGDDSAARMGHWPLTESLPLLGRLGPCRRFLVHVNNTNPILDGRSRERAALATHGVELAEDGLELIL